MSYLYFVLQIIIIIKNTTKLGISQKKKKKKKKKLAKNGERDPRGGQTIHGVEGYPSHPLGLVRWFNGRNQRKKL